MPSSSSLVWSGQQRRSRRAVCEFHGYGSVRGAPGDRRPTRAPPGFVGGDVERTTGVLADEPPADGVGFEGDDVRSCHASGRAGLWPVAALGLLLRGRRRA